MKYGSIDYMRIISNVITTKTIRLIRLFVASDNSQPMCSLMSSIDSFHLSPPIWLQFER